MKFWCVLLLLLLLFSLTEAKKTKEKTHSKSKSKSKSKTKHNKQQHSSISNQESSSVVFQTVSSTVDSGAEVVLSNSDTILQTFSQISTSEISFSTGLQCKGEVEAINVFWMLPNGDILQAGNTSSGLQARCNKDCTEKPNVELTKISTDSNIDEGIYWCTVEYSGFSKMVAVWIVNNLSPPIVTSSECHFVGFDVNKRNIGIFISANVSNGAPTNITCSFNGNRISANIFHEVFDSNYPGKVGVQITVTDIQHSSVPGLLNCSLINNVGSDTVICNVQDSSVQSPVVTDIVRHTQTATVSWSSVLNSGGSYNVYVVSSDGKDYIPFSQIDISGTEAHIRGLHPGYSYIVTVVALQSQAVSSSNFFVIPSVSSAETVSIAQCAPAHGLYVEISLTTMNECQNQHDCSDDMPNNYEDLVKLVLLSCGTEQWNCTTVDPQITKIYCNKESTKKSRTHTTKKDSNTMKVKAMAICDACKVVETDSNAILINEIRTKTKNSNKNRYSRTRQQIADERQCVITYDNCQYSAGVNFKYGPQYFCGDSSNTKSKDSCDCPNECHYSYIETCKNSCSC